MSELATARPTCRSIDSQMLRRKRVGTRLAPTRPGWLGASRAGVAMTGALGTAPAAVLELAKRNQWVLWKEIIREGKATKPPYQPTGALAKSTDPSTWVRNEVAQKALSSGRWKGTGFVFSPEDPYAGVDLDGCRDPNTGRVAEWAQIIIDSVSSYTEVSPSGAGVKIFARGALPSAGRKKSLPDAERISEKLPAIELYGHERYFTVTGQHLEGTPTTIEDRSTELNALYARLFNQTNGAVPAHPRASPTVSLDDQDVLRH